MKYALEIYEDNAGGLYLVMLDNDDTPTKIFEKFEYANESGVLVDAICQLQVDPEAWKVWGECDLMERLEDEMGEDAPSIQAMYEELSGDCDFVARTDTDSDFIEIYPEKMGAAAEKALTDPYGEASRENYAKFCEEHNTMWVIVEEDEDDGKGYFVEANGEQFYHFCLDTAHNLVDSDWTPGERDVWEEEYNLYGETADRIEEYMKEYIEDLNN